MFVWTEELATGNRQIDDQHKEIFRKADDVFRLTDDLSPGAFDPDQVKKSFKFLVTYVFEHFNNEEQLMRETQYADYENHRNSHVQFLKKINQLNKNLKDEGVTPEFASELKLIIIELLVEHIDELDKKFAKTIHP